MNNKKYYLVKNHLLLFYFQFCFNPTQKFIFLFTRFEFEFFMDRWYSWVKLFIEKKETNCHFLFLLLKKTFSNSLLKKYDFKLHQVLFGTVYLDKIEI